MKNFFKKLSFVMALAMVLTALAPAVAGADASYIYKRGNDTQKEAVEVYFGDAETKRDLNVKINGKKTTDGTWKVGNTKIATIDENGVVTPVKNGTTTAKFTDADGNVAKVKVVVGTRAAGVKVKDNGVAVTELAMTVGEAKELKFGAYISKKAKNAGATKSSQDVAMTVEGEAVTTAVDGKVVTVTAAKAGEATITFTAGKKTTTVAVTVVDGLAAAQTGANKITVTGSDLTDKVADYAVKRGTVTVSFKSVKLSEDKKSAVLEAASSVLPKGEYTVSYKGSDAVAFTVVDAVVDSIVINPEYAIMATSKTAVAYVAIFNQFGEDVTTSQYSNVTVSGSDSAAFDPANPYVVNFTSANGYTMNLSQVSLALVCKTNGVNTSKILTVVEQPKLDTAEFKGIYKFNTLTGKYAPATLTEGADLSTSYLVFKVVDQYGFNYACSDAIAKMQVNLSSATGLAVGAGQVFGSNELGDRTAYIAYPLTVNGVPSLGSGNVTMLSVLLTNGKTVSETFSIAAGKKIASLTVTAPNGVYGNQDNTLEFVALDQNGEEIKDYTTLKRLNNTNRMAAYTASGTGLRFVPKADGSAKLVYTAAGNTNPVATPVVLTFLTETNAFTTADLSVQPNRVIKAIVGFNPYALQNVGVTQNGQIKINAADLQYQDQYGNVINGYSAMLNGVTVTAVAQYYNTVFSGTVATATAITNATDAAVDFIDVTGVTHGAVTVKVALDGVTASDYTFTLYNVPVENVTNFAILDIDPVNVSVATTASVTPVVYGTYAGQTIALLGGQDYRVVAGNTVYQAAFGYTFGEKENTVTVVINNTAGTEVTKTYKYSNVDPYAAVAKIPVTYAGNVTVASNASISAATLSNILSVKDQYNAPYGNSAEQPRVTISEYADAYAIDGNATGSLTFKYATAGYRTVHVKYTWANGYTFEADLVINVQ